MSDSCQPYFSLLGKLVLFLYGLHGLQPNLFLPFIDDINSGCSQCACYQILPVEGFTKTEAGGDGSYYGMSELYIATFPTGLQLNSLL